MKNAGKKIWDVLTNFIIPIASTAASVWAAIKCEKLSQQQIKEIADRTSDETVDKLTQVEE